ncbi:uncharacterized protein K460DRAFT_366498 [Cucurbitaria berberidis CBS 394.84]|uniref:Uncharacterized protein n=1 Tax=Cucurbitaria berberidis CBS 394.84 TaxID=1168544 RepID=A0A9P4GHP1_9PLEO|nr:uncharacterized protein K460DRAFT_366498 [Cucurbitaria berberidis CBS 394.84]KAF1845654.1 hypothetical protein K460DRAFT_366498 [Cucurbitaria berberidis CBS 394.84]
MTSTASRSTWTFTEGAKRVPTHREGHVAIGSMAHRRHSHCTTPRRKKAPKNRVQKIAVERETDLPR